MSRQRRSGSSPVRRRRPRVADDVAGSDGLSPELRTLLDLWKRQGHVTWRQITEVVSGSRADPDAAFGILDALERRGVVLVDDPEDAAEQERAYQAHLAEMRRKPCWQLGDG